MFGWVARRHFSHLPSTSARLVSPAHLRPNYHYLTKRQLHKHDVIKEEIFFRILASNSFGGLTADDHTELTAGNIETRDVEFDISGEKLVFNQTWLRDNCHCPKCTHQHSRQRLFTIKDFKRNMFTVSYVQLSSNDILGPRLCPVSSSNKIGSSCISVKWIDGHASNYSLDWLRYINSLYNKPQIDINGFQRQDQLFVLPEDNFYRPEQRKDQQIETWDVRDIQRELKPIAYSDLIDGFDFNDDPTFINSNTVADMSSRRHEAVLSVTSQLARFGLAKVTGVPRERNQVLRVARSLAYERPTGYGTVFDVVVEPSEEINLAYSSLEFDLHSDLNYREMSPGVQLLHCIRDSTEGGLSYFSDSFKAAEELKRNHSKMFEVLRQFPITFSARDPYRDVIFRHLKQVITLDNEGDLKEVYFSPFVLPPMGFRDDVKLFYIALDKFTGLLQSERNKLIVKMNPGDLYLFHNRRVLHGRSAYDATTSSRFLQGCYMDWDEIKCLQEKLLSSDRCNN